MSVPSSSNCGGSRMPSSGDRFFPWAHDFPLRARMCPPLPRILGMAFENPWASEREKEWKKSILGMEAKSEMKVALVL